MNILIDLRPLQSGKISGVEVFTKNIVRELLKHGKNHRFFLWTNSHKPLPKMPNFNAEIIHTKIPNMLLNLSMSLFRYPKIENLINHEIDAVFLPDLRPCPTNLPKYLTIHDLSFIHFKDTFSLKSRLWHKLLRVGKEISEAEMIFVPSEFTKKDIKKVFFPLITPYLSTGLSGKENFSQKSEKIKVISEGGGEKFAPCSPKKIEEIKKKYNLPPKFLLSLSTLEKRKNLKTLIEAFLEANIPDLYLVLAGTKNNSIFAETNLPKNKKVIFTGFIPESDKNALYSASLAFVFPSLFEGFGLPLVEAMASGTPVLCSDISSIPEVVGNSALFFNSSKEDISAKIQKIYTDKSIRKFCKTPTNPTSAEFHYTSNKLQSLNNTNYSADSEFSPLQQNFTKSELLDSCKTSLRKDLIQKGLNQAQKFSWEKSAKKILSVFAIRAE